MRITNSMLVSNMVSNLGNNLERLSVYQRQYSTGKKVEKPSDDPIVATKALRLRTDVAQIEQYERNINDANSWMTVTEDTIGSLGDIFHRVKELAVQGGDGTLDKGQRANIKSEIDQLTHQAIQLANTTYSGRNIFSGFKTDKPLIDESGNFNFEVSNSEQILFEVGVGDAINVNVCGGDLFNNGADITGAGAGQPDNMIGVLKQLSSALGSDTTTTSANIEATLGKIDSQMENILRVRADIGARQNRMEMSLERNKSDNLSFTKLMSENEDVNIAEVIIRLKSEEAVYNASLACGAKIIQPSLIDFLR